MMAMSSCYSACIYIFVIFLLLSFLSFSDKAGIYALYLLFLFYFLLCFTIGRIYNEQSPTRERKTKQITTVTFIKDSILPFLLPTNVFSLLSFHPSWNLFASLSC